MLLLLLKYFFRGTQGVSLVAQASRVCVGRFQDLARSGWASLELPLECKVRVSHCPGRAWLGYMVADQQGPRAGPALQMPNARKGERPRMKYVEGVNFWAVFHRCCCQRRCHCGLSGRRPAAGLALLGAAPLHLCSILVHAASGTPSILACRVG